MNRNDKKRSNQSIFLLYCLIKFIVNFTYLPSSLLFFFYLIIPIVLAISPSILCMLLFIIYCITLNIIVITVTVAAYNCSSVGLA